MRTTKGALIFTLLSALVVLAFAAPATTFGQSAGDEQYVDPFQGAPDEPAGGQSNPGDQDGDQAAPAPAPQPAPEPAPEPADPVQDVPEPTTVPAPAAPAQSTGPALPRTGLPVLGIALTGLFLLGGGVALRRIV
jgi:hypothetical protein